MKRDTQRISLEKEHDRVLREGLIAKKYCDKICGNEVDISCYGNYPSCKLHYKSKFRQPENIVEQIDKGITE